MTISGTGCPINFAFDAYCLCQMLTVRSEQTTLSTDLFYSAKKQ